MAKLLRFGFVGLASLLFPALGRAETPPLDTFVLSNGLHVILAPDPKASLAAVVVSYEVGSGDDPDGRRGLAHFTEHVVAEHTKHIPDARGVLFAAGATPVNARTERDDTVYLEMLPPERLETALWVESDRMGYAADVVTEDVVRGTRGTVGNETRDSVVDRRLAVLPEIVGLALYPTWHPYHGLTQGVGADIDSIHAWDIRAFLATWYSPRNATLVIAGRFEEGTVTALVKRYFEKLEGPPPPVRPAVPPSTSSAASFEVAASVPADAILFGWATPRVGEHDDAALDLAACVLGARMTARLVVSGRASAVAAQEVSAERGSVFYIQATPAPRVQPAAVAKDVEAVVNDVARIVTPQEIEGARHAIENRHLEERQTPLERATSLASLARIGSLDAAAEAYDWGMARYASLTPADVSQAVARWLAPGRRLTITERTNIFWPSRGVIVREWP
jgi:predicted Zn-dependent peptidase